MSVPGHITKELERLREENARLAENNARLTAENELLRQKVDLLIRKIFGTSSEKLDIDQLLLFDTQETKKPAGDGPATEDKPSPTTTKTNAPNAPHAKPPCQKISP